MSMATPATPDTATQILVARLDTDVIPSWCARGLLTAAVASARSMPASMSWTFPERLAGASSLACVGLRGGLRRGGSGGAACYRERGQRARRDPCPDMHRESLLGKPESASLACGGTGLAAIGQLADIAIVQGRPCRRGCGANFAVSAAAVGRLHPAQVAAGPVLSPAREPRCRIASAASWAREVM
jgi:hypothetical protein